MPDATVVVTMPCEHCKMPIEIEHEAGGSFGYSSFYTTNCPHCGTSQEHLLPGRIVDVRTPPV